VSGGFAVAGVIVLHLVEPARNLSSPVRLAIVGSRWPGRPRASDVLSHGESTCKSIVDPRLITLHGTWDREAREFFGKLAYCLRNAALSSQRHAEMRSTYASMKSLRQLMTKLMTENMKKEPFPLRARIMQYIYMYLPLFMLTLFTISTTYTSNGASSIEALA